MWGTGTDDYMSNANLFVLRNWGGWFPIIGLRCTAPHLRLVGYEAEEATVSWWQSEEGEALQLSLAIYGRSPESGLVVTPADTFHTFTGLQADSIYSIRVRKACRYTTAGYDTLVWSEWSSPVVFRTQMGLDEAEAGGEVRLLPNPARSELTVSSASHLTRIELHDVAGVLLYSGPAEGRRTTLDIGFLRPGTYIVTVHTHAGTAHKKLLVRR